VPEPVSKFLLISIDCLRWDALARTNPVLMTPKFDVLTRDYRLAERFFVTAPATRPSHTSLFTGLYPFEHGLAGQTYLRMFDGVTNLFDLLQQQGFAVSGRSERPDVFRFLDYEPHIGPMDPGAANQSLGSLEPVLDSFDGQDGPQLHFLHFWYAHGGYGTAGIPRLSGQLKEWVDAGRAEEALPFYWAAAVQLQEFRIAEILKKIDLSEWAVFLFGDHGEGFTPEVMAHGDCLHENVVRVPLLAHLPRAGWQLPAGPLSMIDLFPTICELAGVDAGYRGYGRSLLDAGNPDGTQDERLVLSELDSLYGVGFLHPGNLDVEHRRVTSRTAIDGRPLDANPDGVRQWSLSDGERLYRRDETCDTEVLREVATGRDLSCDDGDTWRRRYEEIVEGSNYGHLRAGEETAADREALQRRLKDLGYL
jgi:hypothetical protein